MDSLEVNNWEKDITINQVPFVNGSDKLALVTWQGFSAKNKPITPKKEWGNVSFEGMNKGRGDQGRISHVLDQPQILHKGPNSRHTQQDILLKREWEPRVCLGHSVAILQLCCYWDWEPQLTLLVREAKSNSISKQHHINFLSAPNLGFILRMDTIYSKLNKNIYHEQCLIEAQYTQWPRFTSVTSGWDGESPFPPPHLSPACTTHMVSA